MHLGIKHTLSGDYSESGSGEFIVNDKVVSVDGGDSDAYKAGNIIGYICTSIVIIFVGYWFAVMYKRDCKENKMTELQYDTEPFSEETKNTESDGKEVPVVLNSKNTEV